MTELDKNDSYTKAGTQAHIPTVKANNKNNNSSNNTTTTTTTNNDNNTIIITQDINNNIHAAENEMTELEQRILMDYFGKIETMDKASFDAIPDQERSILTKYITNETHIMTKEDAFKLIQRTKRNNNRNIPSVTQTTPKPTKVTYQNPYARQSTNSFSALADNDDNDDNEQTTTPTRSNATKEPYLINEIPPPKFNIVLNPRKQSSATKSRPKTTSSGQLRTLLGVAPMGGRGGGRGERSHTTTTTTSYDSFTTTNQYKEPSTTTSTNKLTSIPEDTTHNFTPTKSRDPENLNTFALHITIRPHKGKTLPDPNIVMDHLLKALQSGDETIKLLSTPDDSKQRITVRSLLFKDTNDIIPHHARFTNEIQLNPRGVLTGNIWFTGSFRYSSIKRAQSYKKLLTSKYYIFVSLNNIGSKVPIDIGFFIHKLYRHDTVESKQYITSMLPDGSPPFQPEQTLIWAGPNDNRRSTSVIKISTKQQDTDVMTKLFEERFHDKNHMTFIRQSYFNCLYPEDRLQFVESQNEFINQHRTYLLRGLKNIDAPTRHNKPNKSTMTIRDWLYTLKTNTNQPLFLDIQVPINDSIEVTFKHTNFDMVKQWERDCIAHIAREVEASYYPQIFAIQEDWDVLLTFTTPWEPPVPQQINFLVEKKSAWTNAPRTTSNSSRSTQQSQQQQTNDKQHPPKAAQLPKQITTSDDSNTITTVTEYQDQIIELQDISRMQSQRITDQQLRIDEIERHYQELSNMGQLQERLTTIENNYKKSSNELNNVNQEMKGITKTNKLLSSSITQHQQAIASQQQHSTALESQLQSLTTDYERTHRAVQHNDDNIMILHEQNKNQSNRTKAMCADIQDQQKQLDALTHIISEIRSVNPSLFPSQSRKRHKQRTPNTSLTEDSKEDTSDNNSTMSQELEYYSNDDPDSPTPMTENELSFFDTNSPGASSSTDSENESQEERHQHASIQPTIEAPSDTIAETDLDSKEPGKAT
jgi:hypothetical protein